MKDKHIKAYMRCAEVFADCSVGVRLKVGVVIVKDNNIIASGYNALPKHIDGALEDENNVTRPEVRHAEKNALMMLTKSTNTSVGATLFCTHACCKFCAIDIVDSGIKKVYYKNSYRDDSGLKYLLENNVEVEQLTD
jgi:dCMP deaminase